MKPVTNEWTRTVDRLREENRSLKQELLQMSFEKQTMPPGRTGIITALVTSILWLSMFGIYWALTRQPSIAAIHPKPLKLIERAVCDRMKPEFDSTLITTDAGAYWTMSGDRKKWCVRR